MRATDNILSYKRKKKGDAFGLHYDKGVKNVTRKTRFVKSYKALYGLQILPLSWQLRSI